MHQSWWVESSRVTRRYHANWLTSSGRCWPSTRNYPSSSGQTMRAGWSFLLELTRPQRRDFSKESPANRFAEQMFFNNKVKLDIVTQLWWIVITTLFIHLVPSCYLFLSTTGQWKRQIFRILPSLYKTIVSHIYLFYSTRSGLKNLAAHGLFPFVWSFVFMFSFFKGILYCLNVVQFLLTFIQSRTELNNTILLFLGQEWRLFQFSQR